MHVVEGGGDVNGPLEEFAGAFGGAGRLVDDAGHPGRDLQVGLADGERGGVVAPQLGGVVQDEARGVVVGLHLVRVRPVVLWEGAIITTSAEGTSHNKWC